MNRCNLGIMGFNASQHKIDECEVNGLPRLPNSVNIIGRIEELKSYKHKNLCKYLDAQRDKHERIVLATEYYELTWEKELPDLSFINLEHFVKLTYELASAIYYLHVKGIVIRNLCLKSIFWTENKSSIKLSNYGLYYMTNSGKEVDFPIGNYKYLAPEAILDLINSSQCNSCQRSDVWSLGMIMLEVLCGSNLQIDLPTYIKLVLNSLKSNNNICDVFISRIVYKNDLLDLIRSCLAPKVSQRISLVNFIRKFEEMYPNLSENIEQFEELSDNPILLQNPEEKYYFWSLRGGNLWKSFRQICDLKDNIPPILTMPILIRCNGDAYFSNDTKSSVVDQVYFDEIFPIDFDRDLCDKIDKLVPLVLSDLKLKIPGEFQPNDYQTVEFERNVSQEELEMRRQPIMIKERDLVYQLRRLAIFQRLLNGLPLTYELLQLESSYDILPLLRRNIWPQLLGVDVDGISHRYTQHLLGSLNERATAQISVDLPRCHSYDQLIVSTTGQAKLSRILTAWLIGQPHLEYTQGMDSLAAVFTRLNFGNEALAFGCLEAFVNKYMSGLFCSSHGAALNEYCLILQQLLVFHRPQLSCVLNIFNITGFTASWIYTGFAHSLPLDKTIRLWDTVLLGDSAFLMMVFIALLCQLDNQSSFCEQASEHIFSVLSNLPQFDLDVCCQLAVQLANHTPPSLTHRSYNNCSTNLPAVTINTSFICPYISLDDLLLLIHERTLTTTSHNPFTFDRACLSDVLIIDIRPKSSYNAGCLPSSRNLPYNMENELTSHDLSLLEIPTYKSDSIILIIVANENKDQLTQKFGGILSQQHQICHVCILRGGIECIRNTRPDLIVISANSK